MRAQAELNIVIRKRADFEYKTTGAGSTALAKSDFLRYIKFESNLDQLIQTRMKKLGIVCASFIRGAWCNYYQC